jgi:hypothetical protein
MSVLEFLRDPAAFTQLALGVTPYPWQSRALVPLKTASDHQVRIAVCTPNGSGKDTVLIAAAAFYWLFNHPKGRVIVTTRSDTQLQVQTIPALDRHWRKFGWESPLRQPRFILSSRTGGQLTGLVTNEGGRMEGHHARKDSPLLIIANEAKSLDDQIFEAIDRCTYSALMLLSSPGYREGRFYEACEGNLKDQYLVVRAGLADCPHIPEARINGVRASYGDWHPITRSTLYGEFMEYSNDAFISHELITNCEYSLGEQWATALDGGNPVWVGVDVGRDRDRTVVWVLEDVNGTYFTRRLHVLDRQPFAAQEEVLNGVMSNPAVRRCCIDETGLGRQFAERAIAKWGSGRVEGISFTAAVKDALAYPARTAFEGRRVRIPRDPTIRADIMSIRLEMTAAGNSRFVAETTKDGHADRFWSLALAIHAAQEVTQTGAIRSMDGIRIGPSINGGRFFSPRFLPNGGALLPGEVRQIGNASAAGDLSSLLRLPHRPDRNVTYFGFDRRKKIE